MKVLVLGARGMLGHKVLEILQDRMEVVGTVRDAAGALRDHPLLGRLEILGDVRADQLETIVAAVARVKPDAVVNCIGIIKQLKAASEPLPSIAINALFPHQLAQICQAASARLVHVSTDCVFSGRRGGYTEADVADAEDLYGRTKLLGEVHQPGCLTLRTSIIGRELSTRTGLVEWFLAQAGGQVRGFARAIYTGLTAAALARLIGELLTARPELSGLWQVSTEPISKHDLLERLDRAFGLGTVIERDESFHCDRSLDSTRFRTAVGWIPPSWDTMVAELAADRQLWYPAVRRHSMA